MTKNKNQRIVLSKDEWLRLALNTLSNHAHSKFSLDALIKAMPVGKGSFYHHFRNRKKFLLALVDYWDRSETVNVIESLSALPEDSSAEDRLWCLICVVHETHSPRHELLVRAMAVEFPEIRERVEAVDRKRIDTVRGLFAEMGFKGEELEMRTMAFVTAATFDGQLFTDLTDKQIRRLLKLRHQWFISPTNR